MQTTGHVGCKWLVRSNANTWSSEMQFPTLDLRRRKKARILFSTQQLLDHTPLYVAHLEIAQYNHLHAALWKR